MSVFYPEGTPTLGNTKVTACPTVAILTAPDLSSEINAAASVDLSCYLFPEGWNPTATTSKGQRKRRLCSKRSQEQINSTLYTIAGLQYVHNPQTADAAAGNEARELLVEDAKIYFVERQGLDAQDTAWAAGQRSITHYLHLGPQIWSGDTTDENGEYYIMQEAVYVNEGPVLGTVAA